MKTQTLNVLLSLLYSALYLSLIYRNERYRRDRAGIVLFSFILGYFAVLPALLLELALGTVETAEGTFGSMVFRAFVVVALAEEGAKYLAVRLFVFRHRKFDGLVDAMVCTGAAGLGFALFENVTYSFGSPAVVLIRGLTAVPLHLAASGFLGFFAGRRKPAFALLGLATAVVVHGTFDLLLFVGNGIGFIVIPLLVALVPFLIAAFHAARRDDDRNRPIHGKWE